MQSNVHSIESLIELSQGLSTLGEEFDGIVQDIQACLNKTLVWAVEDMPRYWRHQTHLAEQRLNSALNRLQQVQGTTNPQNRPSASEEQKEVAKAKARLRLCRSRIETAKHHALEVEHAVEQLAGPLAEMSERVSGDVPSARADLHKMVQVLQNYNQIPPASETTP